MATATEKMNEWGREFLRYEGREVNDDAVIDFEEDSWSEGYCETCWYEQYAVRVSTTDTPDGSFVTETYYGDMGDLVRSMQEGVYY